MFVHVDRLRTVIRHLAGRPALVEPAATPAIFSSHFSESGDVFSVEGLHVAVFRHYPTDASKAVDVHSTVTCFLYLLL